MKLESTSASTEHFASEAHSSQQITRRLGVYALAFAFTLTLAALATPSAQAQAFTLLHTFTGAPADGGFPGGLIIDSKGSLYGGASGGGIHNFGTVFKLVGKKETALYSFKGGADGAYPQQRLVIDAKGDFYGTTSSGGSGICSGGCGTVFKVTKTGKETVLYRFCPAPTNCTDGAYPAAGLIRDEKGNFYGTTEFGGTSKYGTVFKLDSAGKETVLYSFCSVTNCTDGASPLAELIMDAEGNLYGTTDYGGDVNCGCGVVFKLNRKGKETVLHTFAGYPTDGEFTQSSLVMDSSGNLYGTTVGGGTSDNGAVFKVSKIGKESVLYSFCPATGCVDGKNPRAGLVMDAKGNLYGTTFQGGVGNFGCGGSGCGTVFVMTLKGKETVLYSFTGLADGAFPFAVLIRDAKGNLYGTTDHGGDPICGGGMGCGTAFKLTP
jgi:uncharacterized repeat protein (TIGR03803 family)